MSNCNKIEIAISGNIDEFSNDDEDHIYESVVNECEEICRSNCGPRNNDVQRFKKSLKCSLEDGENGRWGEDERGGYWFDSEFIVNLVERYEYSKKLF